MEKEQINQLADAIIQKMKDEHHVFWIDPEVHAEQHGFLALLMKEREEKIARHKRIEEKIAGSAILSGLLFLVGLVGAGFITWINRQLEHPENGGQP